MYRNILYLLTSVNIFKKIKLKIMIMKHMGCCSCPSNNKTNSSHKYELNHQ